MSYCRFELYRNVGEKERVRKEKEKIKKKERKDRSGGMEEWRKKRKITDH